MERHLQHSGDTIQFRLMVNGELTDSEEDVTVQITDGSGEDVGTSATALRLSEGIYEHQPTAAQMALLDTYTAHWTVTLNGEERTFQTQYEVVGGFVFTIEEGRAFRGDKFADANKYPTQTIIDHRQEIEDFLEEVVGYPIVQRGRRALIDGDGGYELFLPDMRIGAPYSVTVTDSAGTATTFDAAALTDLSLTDYGTMRRKTLGTWTSGYRNVAVHYPYGLTAVPGPLKRAALILLYNRLLPSDVSDRAQSFTNESGTLAYSSPNGNRPSGIPEVDAILAKYSDNRVSIA